MSPREGCIYHRYLDTAQRREVTVYRMAYTYRVCLSDGDGDALIEDAYCFHSEDVALAAAASWDGVAPILDAWHKNPCTGTRRTMRCDLCREPQPAWLTSRPGAMALCSGCLAKHPEPEHKHGGP